jgi:hypothetical protein
VLRTASRILSIVFLVNLLMACASQDIIEVLKMKTIAWDQASLRLVSMPGDLAYNGYARMIQLQDRSLFVVYFNSAKGILGRRSSDYGNSWSEAFVVLANTSSHNMDNPEILQLKDGSLLVSTNLRPVGVDKNQDQARRFQIGVIKSGDNGQSWSALKILYSASWKFTEGCWEPKAIQLPSGEVQLYFANEAPYTHSAEQNISMLTSLDGSVTWSEEAQIVSFRKHYRDGMPVPLILKDSAEVAMAIEDNGYQTPLPAAFKISILRTAIDAGWQSSVDGSSPQREYALNNILPASGPYAGAPYIAQVTTGETVLVYQSPAGRKAEGKNELDFSVPVVVVGDQSARNFQNESRPFDIPEGKSGLWNSVVSLDNGEIAVLTSTNGLAQGGRQEVWMIKGRMN